MLTTEFTKAVPEYVTVSLKDYSVIQVTGEQAETFLQGQLTCDLRTLTADNWLYGAHCDNKGKALNIFRICRWGDSFMLIQPKASAEVSLSELQKYAVFSKVELVDATANVSLFGVFGSAAPARLAELVQRPIQQPLHHQTEHCLLHVGETPDQYLILTTQPDTFVGHKSPQIVWDALEIERGRATLGGETIREFVPQMLNLQALAGISFEKGCYIGQETIARMKYLGKQKRALFRLSGAGLPTKPGSTVEVAIGENWRRAGTVINAVSRTDSQLDLLAVLPSDTELGVPLRIKGDDESSLEIHSLPYNLDES